jgi:hypothetical protein
VSYFPYIFLGYLFCGGLRVGIMSSHPVSAVRVREISGEIQKEHVDGAQPV